ncbi:MAK10-like protein [Tanacetum coccineum]
MRDENPIRTLGDYSKPSHEGYRNTIELPIGNNVVPLRSDTIRLVQNGCSFHGLRSEDPNQHLKDFLKLVDSLDLDGSISTWEDLTTRFLAQFFPPGRTAKLSNDILMFQKHHGESLSEAWTRFKDLLQKVPHHGMDLWLQDLTLYDYESWNDPRDFVKPVKAIVLPQDVPSTSDRLVPTTLGIAWRTPKKPSLNTHPHIPMKREVQKLNSMLESLKLVPQSSNTKFVYSKEDDEEVMFIEIIRDDDEPQNEDPHEGEGATTEEPVVEYFDNFPTRDELTYHSYLMSDPIPLIFLRNPIISEGCPYNLKIPCNIGHMHIEKAYIDLNSPLNIMTRMMYNWIIRRKLDPKGNTNGGISNFTGRIKGMHVFVRNFTYVMDFMIVEDISSIIDPRLSQVILGRPFVEISNMTHDPPEGVVRFVRGADEVAYKMPHKIKQYESLSDLEKEHTKSVYLRNEEDKRRGVEYVMSKILGFYKECLELGPEYLNGVGDKGEVT